MLAKHFIFQSKKFGLMTAKDHQSPTSAEFKPIYKWWEKIYFNVVNVWTATNCKYKALIFSGFSATQTFNQTKLLSGLLK
jgi:hypothetical protein